MPKALVTGITGQVGSYMAEYLVKLGYEVHGLDRRKSQANHGNLHSLEIKEVKLIEGDLTDPFSIMNIIREGQYDEIYNLAAQSHVHTSFEQPMLTYEVNTRGVLNLLEAIRTTSPHSKMYQASTSEMFGSSNPPQNENTIFHPRSPYGVSKLASHWLVTNYHESYKLKVACGIMFNTESPRRGDNFVTQKIVKWVANYKYGKNKTEALELGNLDAKRDWSSAYDSVEAIYRICNQDRFNWGFDGTWKSYAFGSGVAISVREFLKEVLNVTFDGEDRFRFEGRGLDEKVIDTRTDKPIVVISPKFFRPAEVEYLLCDPTLIKKELGWEPHSKLNDLISIMVGCALYDAKKE